jgi:DNA-binding transcriptional MerR regulator
MDELYSVNELAKCADVTPRTVRLYVEWGLLEPRRAGRTLCFTPADAKLLGEILRTKRLGFTLAEIHRRFTKPNRVLLSDMVKRIQQIKADANQELMVLERQIKERS